MTMQTISKILLFLKSFFFVHTKRKFTLENLSVISSIKDSKSNRLRNNFVNLNIFSKFTMYVYGDKSHENLQ